MRSERGDQVFRHSDGVSDRSGLRVIEPGEMVRPNAAPGLITLSISEDLIQHYAPTIQNAFRDWLAGTSQVHALQVHATSFASTLSWIISASVTGNQEWRQILRLFLSTNSVFLVQNCVFAIDDALARVGDVEFKDPLLRAYAAASESGREPLLYYRRDPDAFFKLSDRLHEILGEIQEAIDRMASSEMYVSQ